MVKKLDGPFNGAGKDDVFVGVLMDGGIIEEGVITPKDMDLIKQITSILASATSALVLTPEQRVDGNPTAPSFPPKINPPQ